VSAAPDPAAILQALGDPTRRRMAELLGPGPLSVSELAQPFDMSLTAVVQHLQVLERCGLIATEKIGRVRTCSLRPEALDTLQGWIAQRRPEWHARLDRLADLLGEE
jgi:DNA-binding transcriptional ArsR family regulator